MAIMHFTQCNGEEKGFLFYTLLGVNAMHVNVGSDAVLTSLTLTVGTFFMFRVERPHF